jgi:hypothetical protein
MDVLNILIVFVSLSSFGTEFHKMLPLNINALIPYDLVLLVGSSISPPILRL